MKKLQSAAALVVALSMGIGSLAVAQDRGRDGGPRDGRNGSSRWDGDRRDGPQFRGDRDDRGDRNDRSGPQYRGERGPDPRMAGRRGDDRRGAGPDHRFYRGDRLPSQYRSRQYVVEDWRGHRLSAPPRGYHWVQTGGDYVLAAIATGVILQILMN